MRKKIICYFCFNFLTVNVNNTLKKGLCQSKLAMKWLQDAPYFVQQIKPDNIPEGYENHQHNQQDKTDGVDQLLIFLADRRTLHFLNENKKYPSSIKSWEWKAVDNSKINAQERRELENINQP